MRGFLGHASVCASFFYLFEWQCDNGVLVLRCLLELNCLIRNVKCFSSWLAEANLGKSSVLMLFAQTLSNEGKRVCFVYLEGSRLKGKRCSGQILKWFGLNCNVS